MRSRAAVAALAAVCGVALACTILGSAKVSARTVPHCHLRHSRTVVADRQVRVYSVPAIYERRAVRACFVRTGRDRRLGLRDVDPSDAIGVSPILLSGSLVSWQEWSYSHYDEAGYKIRVVNMANGQLLHAAGAYGGSFGGSSPDEPTYWATGLVMDRAGSVAWIETAWYDAEPGSPSSYKVFKSDSSRAAEPLDAGPNIDPHSLRRDGKTISWRNNGQVATAQFVR